jgi:hypothetical protein
MLKRVPCSTNLTKCIQTIFINPVSGKSHAINTHTLSPLIRLISYFVLVCSFQAFIDKANLAYNIKNNSLSIIRHFKLTDNKEGILCFVQINAQKKRPCNLEVN